MGLKRIAVFISGGGSNLQALINYVHQKYGEIALVISSDEKAYGLTRAKESNIKAISLNAKEANYEETIISICRENKIDFIVLAGYLKIISSKLINAYPNKIINIHPSLIPSFCGAGYYGVHVHEKAIEYGVKVSGATVHFVDIGTDTGPIIMQKTVCVEYDDTPITLQKKIIEVEHEILVSSVQKMCKEKLVLEGRKVRVLA